MSALSAVPAAAPLRSRPSLLVVAAAVVATVATAGAHAVDVSADGRSPFPPVVAGASLGSVPLYEVVRFVPAGKAAGKLGPGQRVVGGAWMSSHRSYVIAARPAGEIRADYARVQAIRTSRLWWSVDVHAPDPPKLATRPGHQVVAVLDGQAYLPGTVVGDDGINLALYGPSSAAEALTVAATLTDTVHQCGPESPSAGPYAEPSCVWVGAAG